MSIDWRFIPDFPAYEVSARGQVRSVATAYVLTPRKGIVALSRDGKAHRCAVRDLVAAAWAEAGGVDLASGPDRTAVCFVTVTPTASAELLDLAGEYDCLAKALVVEAREKAQIQADLGGIHQENVRLLNDLAEARMDGSGLREQITSLRDRLLEARAENSRRRAEEDKMRAEIASLKEANAEVPRLRGKLDHLDADNARLREENAEFHALLARAVAKPAAKALSADDKDAEITRLRDVVAEQEAELSLYRASAGN